MRHIDSIIIHCSATPSNRRYTFSQCRHDHVTNRHWSDIGYHYYIERDGTIFKGRPLEKVGSHCQGHNLHSIGICYEGGLQPVQQSINRIALSANVSIPADTRTGEQHLSLCGLLRKLHQQFPQAKLYGHNELSSKACPCFDVHTAYDYIFAE